MVSSNLSLFLQLWPFIFLYDIVLPQIPSIQSSNGYYTGTSGGCPCPPERLLDGDVTTKWNAVYDNRGGIHWVIFDFQEPVKLFNFSFYSLGDYTHSVKMFEIHYSSNPNSEWSKLSQWTASSSAGWKYFDTSIDNQAAYYQYWRWYITSRYTAYQAYVGEVKFQYSIESTTMNPTTMNPTESTQIPDIPSQLSGYNCLNDKLCANLNDAIRMEYDIILNDCVEYCNQMGSSCKMINYFNYLKSKNDSRCYVFDTICNIKSDTYINRSKIAYSLFQPQCKDYPNDWRDSFGDSCAYYSTHNWCNDMNAVMNENDYIELADTKYGLTAIESCCECGGGIHAFNNFTASYDYSWYDTQDDIVCHFNGQWNTKSKVAAWDNLMLYELCNVLENTVEIEFLINTEFESNKTHWIFLCENDEDNIIDSYDFIVEFIANIEDETYELYINSIFFDIDVVYMNYAGCKINILTTIDKNYNVSAFYINGVHPCDVPSYMFSDVRTSTYVSTYIEQSQQTNATKDSELSTDTQSSFASKASINDNDNTGNYALLVIIPVSTTCFICVVILSLFIYRKRLDTPIPPQTETAVDVKSPDNCDSINAQNLPSVPALEDDNANNKEQHDYNICILCCDNQANMFNDPCGHTTYCDECARNALQQDVRCPTCRAQIQCKKIYSSGFI